MIGPFERRGRVALHGADVAWAAKDVFNPAAVVVGDRVCLLVRAEDNVGRFAGTSRIGLATSVDGVTFELEPEPVLYPSDDAWADLERDGGCEDPRVVETADGSYVCTYTAFNGTTARLCVATSNDLRAWTKDGRAFGGSRHHDRWSKSGSIVTEVRDGRLVAALIEGRYWMYWGEGITFAATSADLVKWEPVEVAPDEERAVSYSAERGWSLERRFGARVLQPVLSPRPGRFDSRLTEPGPPALLSDDGIVLIYNGGNDPTHGDGVSPPRAYQPARAVFDPRDPTAVIARDTEPFLRVTSDEATGQVDNVCFAEGLVPFNGEWLLYYGMADSRIGVAAARVRPMNGVDEAGTAGPPQRV